MKISTAIQSVALCMLLAAAPLPTVACGSPDMKTHVGKVLSVDKNAGTFTLLDAESMSPITFNADAALLEKISHAGERVAVAYETMGNRLQALELK
ncbi:MAG: hypothetical protein OER43_11705 [Gammaproteobacteria bacterium]|nr:hypothetical protein [Gammaproteobacteria bacterium]MDH3411622.1 hypothetical protein [Gammaproteobacteria bacterium]